MISVVRHRRQAFRHMTWPERWAAGHAFAALTGVRLALAILGFRRTQARLTRWAGDPAAVASHSATETAATPPPARPGDGLFIASTVCALDRAARCGPGHPSCLPRALALWWLLRRRGIPADLRIGARRAAGRLEAHAWVEHDGQVLGDQADVHVRFAAFAGPVRPRSAIRPMVPAQTAVPAKPASSSRPLEASGG